MKWFIRKKSSSWGTEIFESLFFVQEKLQKDPSTLSIRKSLVLLVKSSLVIVNRKTLGIWTLWTKQDTMVWEFVQDIFKYCMTFDILNSKSPNFNPLLAREEEEQHAAFALSSHPIVLDIELELDRIGPDVLGRVWIFKNVFYYRYGILNPPSLPSTSSFSPLGVHKLQVTLLINISRR